MFNYPNFAILLNIHPIFLSYFYAPLETLETWWRKKEIIEEQKRTAPPTFSWRATLLSCPPVHLLHSQSEHRSQTQSTLFSSSLLSSFPTRVVQQLSRDLALCTYSVLSTCIPLIVLICAIGSPSVVMLFKVNMIITLIIMKMIIIILVFCIIVLGFPADLSGVS